MAWIGSVPIIIIIIAAVAVGPLAAKAIEDRQSYNNSDDLLINNNELNESHHFSSNQTALIKSGKADSLEMKINSLEQMLQTMQSNFTDAHSYIVSLIMRSISCSNGCPDGFFHRPGSSQCYTHYKDTRRSWHESKEKCESEGLILAEPADPISLRKYLVETYGNGNVYLGARGTGSYFRWDRSGRQISNTDAAWLPGQPGSRVSTSYCLVLRVRKRNMDRQPNQPYVPSSCTSRWYTLCEYVNADA